MIVFRCFAVAAFRTCSCIGLATTALTSVTAAHFLSACVRVSFLAAVFVDRRSERLASVVRGTCHSTILVSQSMLPAR